MRLMASAPRRRALLLRLELCDGGANRREWPIFVLLLAEAVRIRAIGRIDRLFQKVGKVLLEAALCGRGRETT